MLVGVSDDNGWARYKDGYIEYSSFDGATTFAERLSHWVRWGEEAYPQTELEVVEVMARALDSLSDPDSQRDVEVIAVAMDDLEWVFDQLDNAKELLEEGDVGEASMVCSRTQVVVADMMRD